MPTSQKQIEANRRNARKSTGPITPEGKEAVRHNALKHGILAKETVITRDDFQEDATESDRFPSSLIRLGDSLVGYPYGLVGCAIAGGDVPESGSRVESDSS